MAVVAVQDSDFDSQLNANSKVIVKYYADWCGSCRLFAPKFKRLSSDERFTDIKFLEVNAEKNPEARKKGQVNNLPTFAVFRNGELIESVCTSKEELVVELLDKLK
ncbi:MAG: thioredoxin family protein [Cytophagaceae bacterium]